mmetsp:Transcript_19237/g.49675  ORF Transcript_19237/g.49675 Transcript_19237/m.49675 type:complete len:380 (-) Transcript_19237:100-1239(-)
MNIALAGRCRTLHTPRSFLYLCVEIAMPFIIVFDMKSAATHPGMAGGICETLNMWQLPPSPSGTTRAARTSDILLVSGASFAGSHVVITIVYAPCWGTSSWQTIRITMFLGTEGTSLSTPGSLSATRTIMSWTGPSRVSLSTSRTSPTESSHFGLSGSTQLKKAFMHSADVSWMCTSERRYFNPLTVASSSECSPFFSERWCHFTLASADVSWRSTRARSRTAAGIWRSAPIAPSASSERAAVVPMPSSTVSPSRAPSIMFLNVVKSVSERRKSIVAPVPAGFPPCARSRMNSGKQAMSSSMSTSLVSRTMVSSISSTYCSCSAVYSSLFSSSNVNVCLCDSTKSAVTLANSGAWIVLEMVLSDRITLRSPSVHSISWS